MNNTLLLLGAICLVCGVVGYMYSSDQADTYHSKALLTGKWYYSNEYTTYKLYTYCLAGLSVLGGVLTAAGIFSNPAPVPERESAAAGIFSNPAPVPERESAAASGGENQESLKPIDEATRKEYKRKYLKSGEQALAFAFVGFILAPLPLLLLPSTPLILCQLIVSISFMAALYGLFLIVMSFLAL